MIVPFFFVHHIINYQYSNPAVKKVFKIPITIGFLFLLFFPVFFEVYTIYQIIINNTFSFVPTACAFLTGIFCLGAIIQALNPDKLN
ncbi:hypothetical protein IX49_15445 [Cellulophaga lytica]|nr:hypothetical protein IX49_15445 [Cellulophaga lytica]